MQKIRWILSMTTLAGVIISFQNCSNTGFLQSRDLASEWAALIDPYFAYYYTEAPKAYFDGVIVIPNNADPANRFNNIGFIGSLSLADGSQSQFSYKLELRKNDGTLICPQQIGTLGTETRIEFECVTTDLSMGASEWMVAWVQYTISGDTFELEKPFR